MIIFRVDYNQMNSHHFDHGENIFVLNLTIRLWFEGENSFKWNSFTPAETGGFIDYLTEQRTYFLSYLLFVI